MTDLPDLPDTWTPIAYQGLQTTPGGFHHLYWKPLPGAPIDYADAQEMIKAGLLISAQRRPFAGAAMELVVKRASTQPTHQTRMNMRYVMSKRGPSKD